jgi:hypothetical protein
MRWVDVLWLALDTAIIGRTARVTSVISLMVATTKEHPAKPSLLAITPFVSYWCHPHIEKVISEKADLKISPFQTCFWLFSFVLHEGRDQSEFFSADALIFPLCSESPATETSNLEHALREIGCSFWSAFASKLR